MTTYLALLLKPLIAFAIIVLIVLPIKWVLLRLIPDGKLKRILLFRWKV